jgi:hypothetical protein
MNVLLNTIIVFSKTFSRNPLRFLRMNVVRRALPFLSAKRTAKNSAVKSIPIYEKLGLKLIVKSLPYYARFECLNGNSTFSIHQTEILPKGDGIYVYFECENLGEQVENLKENGIKFEQEPTDQNWLWKETQ